MIIQTKSAHSLHQRDALEGAADVVFFFSSRRRHTISKRDWSSDVCSSDLFLTRQNAPGSSDFLSGRTPLPLRCELRHAARQQTAVPGPYLPPRWCHALRWELWRGGELRTQ